MLKTILPRIDSVEIGGNGIFFLSSTKSDYVYIYESSFFHQYKLAQNRKHEVREMTKFWSMLQMTFHSPFLNLVYKLSKHLMIDAETLAHNFCQ
jgi:hypothetical protein